MVIHLGKEQYVIHFTLEFVIIWENKKCHSLSITSCIKDDNVVEVFFVNHPNKISPLTTVSTLTVEHNKYLRVLQHVYVTVLQHIYMTEYYSTSAHNISKCIVFCSMSVFRPISCPCAIKDTKACLGTQRLHGTKRHQLGQRSVLA